MFVQSHHLRRARVLCVEGRLTIVARGNRLYYCENGKPIKLIAELPVPFAERVLSLFSFTRLGLRLGVHSALPVGNGRILIVLKRRFVLVEQHGSVREIDRVHRGNKPASRAICKMPDGTVIYGEYFLNKGRQTPVAVYRTDNIASGFKKIYEFVPGVVRHIHFVQWDPYDACLWMGTGDADSECHLFKSTNKGESWTRIGGGSQDWRAVSVIITAEALFWGTDAGSDAGLAPNHIIRFDRGTKSIIRVQKMQGPCHGSGIMSDGTLLVSTGVEGGKNELDVSSHLWASRDGNNWKEIYSRPKKKWPHIIQFGVMRIPPGTETSDRIHFTGLALKGSAETWYCGKLEL